MKKCAIKKNSHKIVDYEMKIQHGNHDKIHDTWNKRQWTET